MIFAERPQPHSLLYLAFRVLFEGRRSPLCEPDITSLATPMRVRGGFTDAPALRGSRPSSVACSGALLRVRLGARRCAEPSRHPGAEAGNRNAYPLFFSDRLEAERDNGFFQRRLFGG